MNKKLKEINELLPDNDNAEISENDIRESFKKTFEYVDEKSKENEESFAEQFTEVNESIENQYKNFESQLNEGFKDVSENLTKYIDKTSKAEIEKININVRNLVRGEWHLSGNDVSGSDNTFPGVITINEPVWNAWSWLNLTQNKAGQSLSISFWVRVHAGVKLKVRLFADWEGNFKSSEIIEGKGEWQLVKIENVAVLDGSSKTLIEFQSVEGSGIGLLFYRDLMVVFGSKAVDYIPAPEDLIRQTNISAQGDASFNKRARYKSDGTLGMVNEDTLIKSDFLRAISLLSAEERVRFRNILNS